MTRHIQELGISTGIPLAEYRRIFRVPEYAESGIVISLGAAGIKCPRVVSAGIFLTVFL